jgi:hypothetical protein
MNDIIERILTLPHSFISLHAVPNADSSPCSTDLCELP